MAQSLHSEPGNGCRRSFLDLAKALQAAVLRISMDSTGQRKALYHWAAFTLQGCWNKFPLLKIDSKGKEKSSEAGDQITEAFSKLDIK